MLSTILVSIGDDVGHDFLQHHKHAINPLRSEAVFFSKLGHGSIHSLQFRRIVFQLKRLRALIIFAGSPIAEHEQSQIVPLRRAAGKMLHRLDDSLNDLLTAPTAHGVQCCF